MRPPKGGMPLRGKAGVETAADSRDTKTSPTRYSSTRVHEYRNTGEYGSTGVREYRSTRVLLSVCVCLSLCAPSLSHSFSRARWAGGRWVCGASPDSRQLKGSCKSPGSRSIRSRASTPALRQNADPTA
jgi:hypothetical protein